jgi:hypothetical protein
VSGIFSNYLIFKLNSNHKFLEKMKRFVLIGFSNLFLVLSFCSFVSPWLSSPWLVSPQAVQAKIAGEYDTVDFNKISISGVKLGGNFGVLLEKMGSPDSVRKEETPDAKDSNQFEMYLYGQDVFYVMDEIVSGFEIRSNRFQIDNLSGLKVGDAAAKVKKMFPKSYKIRDIDDFNPSWNTVSVQFGSTDSFLEIAIADGKIRSIITSSDDDEEE